MKIKRPIACYAYLCLFLSSASFANCDFDTDDADGPDFLDKIIEYFAQVVDRRLGQTRVYVTSAHSLSDANTDRLKTALNKILGKTILIDTQVDESLIGGVMLRIGDQVADDTIRNRLDILKRTIEKEEVA